jgi:DNA-binding transcriptional LysR family regulator
LGTALFERRNQGCQLTEAGKVLLEHAAQTLRAHDAALTKLKVPSLGGLFRLGILDEADPQRISEIFRCLVRVCPRTNLEVSVKPSAELMTDYRRGRLDVIFAAASSISEDALSVWREEVVWVGGPTMRRTEGPVPLVVLRDPCAYRSAALAALTSARRPWTLVCTSTTMKGVRAGVEAGIGVTIVDRRNLTHPLKRLGFDWSLPRLNDVVISAFCATPRFTGVLSVLREMLSTENEKEAISPGGA